MGVDYENLSFRIYTINGLPVQMPQADDFLDRLVGKGG